MEDQNHGDQKPHAIIFPLGFQGHVTPAINLAMKLASNGFKITFVNTQITHHEIVTKLLRGENSKSNNDREDIFAGARESGLDVRYKVISDGFPLTFDRLVDHDRFFEGSLHVFPPHVDELVGELMKEEPPVSCLIADTFHPWISEISKKYNLVSVSFWTQPALVFTLAYHLDLLKLNGHFASPNGNREDTIDYIPGVKAIEPKDLMTYLRDQVNESTASVKGRLVKMSFDNVKNIDFVLCNTVEDLEPDTIWALKQKQPFFAVGPILAQTHRLVPTSLRSESDCNQWLNTKPRGSVLYVSLGSLIPCSEAVIEELAHGLVLSNVSFIWILRSNATGFGVSNYTLPLSLLNQIDDEKGLIVPWCNQVEVISSPSIGGFLTHCGWNSVLDSVSCGVPMLCFPLAIDQITNRKLVVDDWKVGLSLCDDGAELSRVGVAEKIGRLMGRKLAEEDQLRNEAKKIRDKLKNALAKDGSSERNLFNFISDVKAKISDRVRE